MNNEKSFSHLSFWVVSLIHKSTSECINSKIVIYVPFIGVNDMTNEYVRKPEWLKIKLNTNEQYTGLKKMMREKKLHTVCEEAKCPEHS